MPSVLILDLIHGLRATCGECLKKRLAETLPVPGEDRERHVFLLYGQQVNGDSPLTQLSTFVNGDVRVHVLDFATVTECLYLFKKTVDELDLSSVQVITSSRGREVLRVYQELLFTAVYSFEYLVKFEDHTRCPADCPDTPVKPVQDVDREVSIFMRQLPTFKGDVNILRSAVISDVFGHGFSCRTGGVSSIPTLSSLNLFSSSRRRDPKAVVAENVRRLAVHAGFYPRPIHLVKVNHASDVWVMGKVEPESYDSIVTNQTGVVIAAPGADCMPLLFVDPVSKVIGAAHAGWKGTLMGVAMATVGAMVREFGCRASDIVVAIGPSVGACCFTLEREQAMKFHTIHPDCVPDPRSHAPHVNIRLATRILLQRGGVLPDHIHDDTVTDRPSVTPCTSCHPESFFSHVRDGLNFGTQLGFLWIRDTD